MKTVDVFVYGTLRKTGSNHDVVKNFIMDSESYQLHGALYNVGMYPALVLHPTEQVVVGELITIPEHALSHLDRLEGFFGYGDRHNLYDRVLYKDNNGREFYVYTWPMEKVRERKLKLIECGDWISFQRGLVFSG